MTASPDSLYLDHLATAPMLPCALEAMWPWMARQFANPSSPHGAGQAARAALEQARAQIAAQLRCHPDELVFTSGGSEANNLAVKGLALAAVAAGAPRRLLVSPLEHASVRGACDYLRRWHGFSVESLQVDACGRVQVDDFAERLRRPAALCTVVLAHNEIGTVQPARALAERAAAAGVALHLDAVQALPWGLFPSTLPGVTALSFSGHKLGAGRGVGGLFLRAGTPIEPLVHGGHQERGLRGGTEPLPAIIGLAAALDWQARESWPRARQVAACRDRLIAQVLQACPRARLTGDRQQRLPGHASFVFPGLHGDALRQRLEMAGLLCTSVAACSGEQPEPSPSLLALGLDAAQAQSALRLGLPARLDAALAAEVARQLAAAVAELERLAGTAG